MSITKVIGAIEYQISGEHGRIKVISFKKDGNYIYDSGEIKKEFPPEGFVFAPLFFDHQEFKLHSLIEFPFKDFKSSKPNGDLYLLDYNLDCKSIGFPIFKVDDDILSGEFSINQAVLNKYSDLLDSQHFYISNKEVVLGPFKNINEEILPRTGKEVCRYALPDLTIYTSGESSYLLTAPLKNEDLIDCMTTSQLSIWFKDQIKLLKLNVDFEALSTALKSQQLEGLDIDRLKRVLTGLDQISLTQTELKFLADSSKSLEELYVKALQNAHSDLKKEFIVPANNEKEQIGVEITSLELKRGKIQRDLEGLTKKLEDAKKEYDKIISDKGRLIEDIKVHSLVLQSQNTNFSNFSTSYEELFESQDSAYKSINEFIEAFTETLECGDEMRSKFGANSILQFKESRFFLSNCIEAIIQIARLSNNCKIVIQQVEPDWLKFENLYTNGLASIWNSAHANSHLLHFYILEDMNLASIECYGKPILDLQNGVRKKIPGIDTLYPPNLWIFCIPLAEQKNQEFGLPLLKNTFKKWAFFPKVNSDIGFTYAKSAKHLSVEMLVTHDSIIPSFQSDYFNEL